VLFAQFKRSCAYSTGIRNAIVKKKIHCTREEVFYMRPVLMDQLSVVVTEILRVSRCELLLLKADG
jgi:hypothetical protein